MNYGYLRVSTDRQADSGLGIDAQRTAILGEATRRGWAAADLEWVEETASGSSKSRPELERARENLKRGDVLVVASASRLSRSLTEFLDIMGQAQKVGWCLICLDSGVDLTTPAGEMVATLLATFAAFEKRLVSDRTSAALAEARARGVKLGRPVTMPADVRARIRAEREKRWTLQRIANNLNRDDVPRPQGGAKWYPSTVRGALR